MVPQPPFDVQCCACCNCLAQVPAIPMPPEFREGLILEFDAPLTLVRHNLVVLMLTQVSAPEHLSLLLIGSSCEIVDSFG